MVPEPVPDPDLRFKMVNHGPRGGVFAPKLFPGYGSLLELTFHFFLNRALD